jgi:hypothetical protein
MRIWTCPNCHTRLHACRSNDYWAEFPYSVTIDTAAYTDGWTDSEWVPTAATAKAWWPSTYGADYAGARVTFTLTAADRPDYEWDNGSSASKRLTTRRSTTRRAVSVSSRLH